jgi:putative restriction endonuclease
MTGNWPKLAKEIASVDSKLGAGGSIPNEQEEGPEDYVGLTRSAVIEARIGQSFFRNAVLSAYDFKCCITSLARRELLVASHIVPWSDDKANRLNPRNGLCLSAVHDRAFDAGLLTVSDDFRVLLSPSLREMKTDQFVKGAFWAFENQPIHLPQKFKPDAAFLRHHREKVFRA